MQDDYPSLDFDWSFWGRPEQIARPGTWDNWLILAGCDSGKTRTGAEWVRGNMCSDTPLTGGRWGHVALVAETAADARDVMVRDGKMASDPTLTGPASSLLASVRMATLRARRRVRYSGAA